MDRKFIYGATGVLCLVALLSLPYGFYTFLRLVVSVASITAAMQLKSEENNFWLVFGSKMHNEGCAKLLSAQSCCNRKDIRKPICQLYEGPTVY